MVDSLKWLGKESSLMKHSMKLSVKINYWNFNMGIPFPDDGVNWNIKLPEPHKKNIFEVNCRIILGIV